MRIQSERSKGKGKQRAGKVLALFMSLTMLLSVMAVPQQAYAASMAKKSKAKYKVTVHNVNSNTVLKKGTKVQIQYTATKTKGGVTTGTKVKFKSSKKKVASVSKKGVIKAKKKGTAYITVYCKSKPSKKKKIKIRVGTPVSSVSISGYRYLRVGRGSDLDASVNKGATNKNVSWWSDNTAVATVNSNGYVKAKSAGTCTIYATAKDGSGVYGTRKVIVHQYLSGETQWIAHRGLHTSAKENTEAAFEAAGNAGGFWGCECDIWESRRVSPAMPDFPGLPEAAPVEPDPSEGGDPAAPDAGSTSGGSSGTDGQTDGQNTGGDQSGSDDQQEEILPDVSELKTEIVSWPAANSMEILDNRKAVKDAWNDYSNKVSGLSEEQIKKVHLQMLADPDNRESEDYLRKLYDAYKWVCEFESIDLPVNHNSTFSEVWGNGNYVRNLSADEIRSQLPGVCFLDTYLKICQRHGMVPVIEFKDSSMSDEAIKRALDMVEARGLLDKAVYISFYDGILQRVKWQAEARLGHEAETYYLINDGGSDGATQVSRAKADGFTGVSLSKSIIDSSLYNQAKANGLKVGTWTYKDKASDDDKLYRHMIGNGWDLEFVTVDYRLFR